MPDARDERPNCTVVRTAAKDETFYSTLMFFMDSKGTLYGFSDRMTISAIFPSSRLPLSFSSKAAYALSRWPSSQRCGPAHARKDWSGSQTCVSIESDRERCRGRRNRMKRDSVSLKRNYRIEGSGTLLSKDPIKIGVQFLSRAYESA